MKGPLKINVGQLDVGQHYPCSFIKYYTKVISKRNKVFHLIGLLSDVTGKIFCEKKYGVGSFSHTELMILKSTQLH